MLLIVNQLATKKIASLEILLNKDSHNCVCSLFIAHLDFWMINKLLCCNNMRGIYSYLIMYHERHKERRVFYLFIFLREIKITYFYFWKEPTLVPIAYLNKVKYLCVIIFIFFSLENKIILFRK